jgi:hypothetical protein
VCSGVAVSYEIVTHNRAGRERVHPYAGEDALAPVEAGQAPHWGEARRYLDSLILEEVDDDLLEQCGVDSRHDPQETQRDTVKQRLRNDLEPRHASNRRGSRSLDQLSHEVVATEPFAPSAPHRGPKATAPSLQAATARTRKTNQRST